MIILKCPRCLIDLKRKSLNSTHFYNCTRCNGTSITTSALKKFIEKDTTQFLFIQTNLNGYSSKLKCPICLKQMKSKTFSEYDHIEIDACDICLNFWFDDKEIINFKDQPSQQVKSIDPILEINLIKENYKIKYDFEHRDLRAYFSILGLPAEQNQDVLDSFPVITWSLIIGIFLISTWAILNENVLTFLALNAQVGIGHYLLTSMSHIFVHLDYFHLFGNLYFIWLFGDNTEDDMGTRAYVNFIIVSTFLTSLIYIIFFSDILLVGSSGLASSIMGYYLTRFPKRKFTFLFFVIFYAKFIAYPAWIFGLLFLFKEFVGLLTQIEGATNISHLSHLSGFIIGATYAYYFKKKI